MKVNQKKMNRMVYLCRFFFSFVFLGLMSSYASGNDTNTLLDQAAKEIRSAPAKSTEVLADLEKLKDQFTPAQEGRFYLLYASSLGFQGRHKDRVDLVNSVIDKYNDADLRARFLYQLSTSYVALGDYEKALSAMNEGVILIPRLSNLNAKMDTLQSAVSLLNSVKAYEDSINYAQRLFELSLQNEKSPARCFGIADKVEINFLRGNNEEAKKLASKAIEVCDQTERPFISLIIKSLVVINIIDEKSYVEGITRGVPLLASFSEKNKNSDYLSKLEEAIARAYLEKKEFIEAEKYAYRAYSRSKQNGTIEILEKSSETMAKIRLNQGFPEKALEYYDIALKLKNRLLDEQLQKNLAYQRVKFDVQDKANQLTLLEQKNRNLRVEQQLQKKEKQNLLLMIALGCCALLMLGLWLWRVIKQKNNFQRDAQTDGLTQICNRNHFLIETANAVSRRVDGLSMIFFDMDHFKKINDSFGHPTGDWVLKNVSQTITGLLRKDDVFGRLGGEEFGICLPSTDTHAALQFAERCRAAIAAIESAPSGFRFPLSASFGVATMDAAGIDHFEKLIESADKALYQSKSDGRNRVSVFS